MNIFTGEYKELKISGLLLNKKRNQYIFLDEKEYLSENFKGESSYISLYLPDFDVQKVQTPPVKDKSAIEFILKNKLSSQLEENIENYKIIYLKDDIQSTPMQYVFNVFLIKKEYIHNTFSENILENLKLLTVSIFSLAGFTKFLNKDGYVLNFYGDEKRAIVVLCKDGNVEYARQTPAPEFIFSDEDLRNFYYETLNLTYVYLKQNRNIKIESLLLSGTIVEDENLANDIYGFTGLPIYSLNPTQLIKGIDVKLFSKHTIPIGNLFLDEKYDIRENELLYKRKFSIFSKYTAIILGIFFIIFSILLFKTYSDYKSTENQLNTEKQLFKHKAKTIIADIKLSPEEIKYYVNYITLYNDAFKITFFDFLEEIKPLLYIHKFNKLSFKKLSNNRISLTLQSSITFNSLISLNRFNTKLQNVLKQLKNKMEIRNHSKTDVNKLTITLDITLIKLVKR